MPTETSKAKRNHIADIRCTSCGAPADYDIRTGGYTCSYCGGKVEISEVQEQQRGFRELRKKNMQESLGRYCLQRAPAPAVERRLYLRKTRLRQAALSAAARWYGKSIWTAPTCRSW